MSQPIYRAEPWAVTERSYQPELNEFHETIFHLANGYMGVRATPEEGFSGQGTQPGTYVASIYDLVPSYGPHNIVRVSDRMSVMVNAPDWFGVEFWLGGERFDPRQGKVSGYCRRLDMRRGVLTRELVWQDRRGRRTELRFTRFVSHDNMHVGGIRSSVRPLNWSGPVRCRASLTAARADAQDPFCNAALGTDGMILGVRTRETKFETVLAAQVEVGAEAGAPAARARSRLVRSDRAVERELTWRAAEGRTVSVTKLVAVCTSREPERGSARVRAARIVAAARRRGFDALLADHEAAWRRIWDDSDIRIDGHRPAQQGIRYCVFSLHQTYVGHDPRVNIPAKGLSGPGYGGLYWWDTEAYMMPFFLYTEPAKARALLEYRHRTLDGARHKARAYGFDGALFPWVTIWGEECSGDWEYGMIEHHVAAAVAHGVDHYVQATGDEAFLWERGAEILVETSRFWASRVTWSPARRRYVINFVTGPDEYAVGVNNNCYTNWMARFNLEKGIEAVRRMRRRAPALWARLARKLKFREDELRLWRRVAGRMHIPYDPKSGLWLQDDTFAERDPFDRRRWPAGDRPTGRWNWYRRIRSQVMKQADILMLMHMQNESFTRRDKRINYRYYEPKCVHESSLSPAIHSILASEAGLADDAFRYYLMSARLDLDDVNGNTGAGQHTASLAGSWRCVVTGFGGMRVKGGGLCFEPRLPAPWKRLSFRMTFRGRRQRSRQFCH